MKNYTLEAMSLAATNLEQMVNFYSSVFSVQFTEQALEEVSLYEGRFAGIDFCLFPAEAARTDAQQTNRMQFDIYVEDLHAAIDLVEAHGGRTNGRIGEDESVICIGVYDPDENFMVFKQRKARPVA